MDDFEGDRLDNCAAKGGNKFPVLFDPGLHFRGGLRPFGGFLDGYIGYRAMLCRDLSV